MRIKSFVKLKKKGLAISGRPKVNRISIRRPPMEARRLHGDPFAKVDPKGASPKFPLYGSKLINGYAQKHLKCSKCKVEMGWDVVAVVNMRENI
jgi:hypothetical protein